MSERRPQSIGTVMQKLFSELGLSDRLKRAEALEAWSEVVGEQIARISTAERIVGKKLFVHVENSAWRNELSLKKPEILRKLNAHLGGRYIDDIKFH
jgi:predicted nucleic acid-binding Zn ribbon protein